MNYITVKTPRVKLGPAPERKVPEHGPDPLARMRELAAWENASAGLNGRWNEAEKYQNNGAKGGFATGAARWGKRRHMPDSGVSSILRVLEKHGEVSTVDLSGMTGVKQKHVSTILNRLRREGVVEKCGEAMAKNHRVVGVWRLTE